MIGQDSNIDCSNNNDASDKFTMVIMTTMIQIKEVFVTEGNCATIVLMWYLHNDSGDVGEKMVMVVAVAQVMV